VAGCMLVSTAVLVLSPILVLATAIPSTRNRSWQAVLWVDAQHLRLVDPAAATLLTRVVNAEADRHTILSWARVAYVLLLTIVLAPLSLMAVVMVPMLGVTALVSVPFTLTTADAQILGWDLDTPPETLLLALFGLTVIIAAAFGLGALAFAQVALATRLVGGDEALRAEVERLHDSRDRLLSAIEAERARIEGELHDRVQHRLAALSMRIGMATSSPEASTRKLARTTLDQVQETLRELRAVVRGIAPHALTDHGLYAAVADLAADFPVTVEVDLNLPERLPPHVEQSAYLVVSEAMTNAAKHSNCDRLHISGGVHRGALHITVTDNGRGGAALAEGQGLMGLAARLDAIDGTLVLNSPPGGPTGVTMQCRLY
jgi:signal transduction histidine kinase